MKVDWEQEEALESMKRFDPKAEPYIKNIAKVEIAEVGRRVTPPEAFDQEDFMSELSKIAYGCDCDTCQKSNKNLERFVSAIVYLIQHINDSEDVPHLQVSDYPYKRPEYN